VPIDHRFVDCLYEPSDLLEVRLIPRPRSLFCQVDRLFDLNSELQDANAVGQNIYIGANPRKRQGGKARDVALARCLFVDLDKMTVGEALRRIADAGLPTPTCTVNSGHGLHAYWRLSRPLIDLQRWVAAQKYLIRLLASDPVIHDPPRIMRLPAFTNHKTPAALCQVIDTDSQRRYELEEIVPASDDPQQVTDYWLQRALRRATPGNRNDTGLWLACQLRDAGADQVHVEHVLRQYAHQLGDGYTEDEAAATARSAYSRQSREPARADRQVSAADPQVIPLIEAELPDIPPGALPEWARDHASALSTSKEVSVTMATLLQLATMASCVQRAFKVQVEDSYCEPLCIYAAPALESGERKTAVHGPVVGPLFAFQKTLRDRAKVELQAARVQQRLIEQEIRALEKRHLSADRDHRGGIEQEIIQLTSKLPLARGLPQVIADDFTEAALSVALASNGESLLVTSDAYRQPAYSEPRRAGQPIPSAPPAERGHQSAAGGLGQAGREGRIPDARPDGAFPVGAAGVSRRPAEAESGHGQRPRFSGVPQWHLGYGRTGPASRRGPGVVTLVR
jgi:hypothetical protein